MMKENRINYLISQIRQVGTRILDRKLTENGVDAFNGAQGRILYVLWQKDGISISEISRKTGLVTATLTGMIDRMEQAGLVKRTQDPGDRRKYLIVLTEKTRSLRDGYEKICREMDEVYFEGFSEQEIETLQSLLQRVYDNLDKQ